MNTATQKFSGEMARLGLDAPRIAVAVSGGGDSMALALLISEWLAGKGEMVALTVDHGLRPESRAEAEAVQKTLEQRGIAHEILSWQGEKPATHIQERAREMRYRLLLGACKRKNFPVLALAHNAEDQMETFWMRLAHGSGLDGLSGMAPSRDIEGIRLIRPLLSFTRAELREVCKAAKMEWVEDPSNANEKFLRPKLRAFEEVLAGEGLTPQRLAMTAQKLSDARDALRFYTAEAREKYVRIDDAGYALLDRKFAVTPADIQRRLIAQLLECVAHQEYPPGFETVEPLRLGMLQSFAGRTAAGCEIAPEGNGFLFCREAAAAQPVKPHDGMVWDGRFVVSEYPPSTNQGGESLALSLLGEAGVSALRKTTSPPPALEKLPGKVRRVLPAFFQGENPVCVPHLNWTAPDAPRGLEKTRLAFLGRVKIV